MKETQRPPSIQVTKVYSSAQDPKWNYGKYVSFDGKRETMEPCCLKRKPCWECK